MTTDSASNIVTRDVEISAIVPVSIRHVDVKALHAQYCDALASLGRSYELIYVVDGAFEEVIAGLDELLRAGERLTAVYLTRTFGESTALMAGFEQAAGTVIITLPAYYQIDPADICKLVAALGSTDMAVACRWPRVGGPAERLRRWAFHGLARWMTGLSLHDLGCSARAMKRQVLEEISLYGDQHRLLPALADRQGFRVQEVQVRQSPQDRYAKGYRAREYAHRLLDVFAVFFLVRFTKKPLRFFGMVGASTLCIGTVLVLYLVADRVFFGGALANRPALLLSSLLVVLGLQLFALGLLGELIIFTHARGLKDYQIDRVIEFSAADRETA